MDENNVADTFEANGSAGTEPQDSSFAAESVPDPWYTGDFEETYSRVLTGCKAWLDQLGLPLPSSLICERIQNMKEFYETYKVYLEYEKFLEIAALGSDYSICFAGFSAIPGQGVLTLIRGRSVTTEVWSVVR